MLAILSRYWWILVIGALVALSLHLNGLLTRTKVQLGVMTTARMDSDRLAEGWEQAFRASEKARAGDLVATIADAAAADRQCDARLAAARKSGAALQTLIQRPVTHDQKTGCPVRELAPPGLLRDVLKPGAADSGRTSPDAAGRAAVPAPQG